MNNHLFRIVNMDYYMSSPTQGFDQNYSEFRGTAITQVPVIRLFGSNPVGEKVCLHVHGVFPYFYIPFDGSQDPNSLMYKIATSIDKSVNISLNQATSTMQHVYKITLVKGIPMYGYHAKEHQFFKINLYNPLLLRKVTALVMNESTLGKLYQPHEAHLNFILQFMIDFNLHGMSNIILSKLKYRHGSKDVDPELLLPPFINKISVCELEADCLAEDILNRNEVASGNIGANPGIASIWADEQQRRRNKAQDSQIPHLLELNRTNLPPTNSHLVYEQLLKERMVFCESENDVESTLNTSVYPAEAPYNSSILNASLIETQTSNSSFDESIQHSESNKLNVTLDDNAQEFLHVLNDLEKQANESKEDDSILTQLMKNEDEDNKELEDNELDFSMSFDTPSTPTKICPEQTEIDENSDDSLNKTLIPQIDGSCDETPAEGVITRASLNSKHTKYLSKTLYVKLVRINEFSCTPFLNKAPLETSSLKYPAETKAAVSKKIKKSKKTVKYTVQKKKSPKNSKLSKRLLKEREKKKAELDIKKFVLKINRMKKEDQLAAIVKKIHKKDKELMLFLQKGHEPKFRVIPKEKIKPILEYKQIVQMSNVIVLHDIISKLSNYVEPTLVLSIRYPNNSRYIYNYEGNILPEIIKIPLRISKRNNKDTVDKYMERRIKRLLTKRCKNTKEKFVKREEVNDEIEGIKEEHNLFGNHFIEDVKNCDSKETINPKSEQFLFDMAKTINEQLHLHMNYLFQCPFKVEDTKIEEACHDDINYKFNEENLNKTIKAPELKVTLSRLEETKRNNECLKPKPASIKMSQRIRSFRSMPALDGTFDSDSSSEDETGKKRKFIRTNSKYKPLPISVEKSPKAHHAAGKPQASKDRDSLAKTCKKDALPINTPNQKSVCDTNVKRQLFDNHPDTTIIEEKTICYYTPTKSKSISKKPPIESTSEDNLHELHLEDTSNSSALFSSEGEDTEQPAITTRQCTTAEIYDKTSNFNAKEGCSKFLTPSSQQLSGSSSSDLLTPYQLPTTQNIITNTTKHQGNKTLEGSFSDNSHTITITPKYLPPTKQQILNSLNAHNIPRVFNQGPFYSNLEDVTGSVEIGFNTLKITSKTTAHLTDFVSQTDALTAFRRARLEELPSDGKSSAPNMKNVILSYSGNNNCILTPVRKPPDLKTITAWLDERTKAKDANTPQKRVEKIKILVPASPGANSDTEEMDLTLTLSPGTPKNSPSLRITNSSGALSPVVGNESKKRKKEIRKKMLCKSARRSLTPSQDHSLINSGEITGVTISTSYLNKSVENYQNARAILEHQNLTVLVMELHVRARADLKPDPDYDSIRAIFYSVLHDVPEPNPKGRNRRGVVCINSLPLSPGYTKVPLLDGVGIDCDVTYVDSEEKLIEEFLKIIHHWDPDIFAGYETELLSWGYLIERGFVLGMNLKSLLGRVKDEKQKQREDDGELKLTGRILLNVWRLMRHEIALQSYTFESVVYHILHKRVPLYSFKSLSFWWDHRTHLYRHKTVKYYITRVETVLELFDKLDFLGRTSELARLFGILFFEVLSRGSQFRVESMMLRLAKPLNFIAVSPNVQQRALMKAPEYIPLVMEPESKLYDDPVIVLDFQSLYPSIIIAYNYCFTTCVGRVECLGKKGAFKFGATELRVSRNRLKKLIERNQLNFSPCGVGFAKKEVRDGIMPRMLREILDTRLMVKNSMKENKDDKILQKVLHSRQLGLKLIANVTYGYTAANFSGRMPAVELGDSVVSKGRETLQRAVEMVERTPEWGSRVVYGDTDSLFVLVPGQTKERAFEIGKKIAEAVTNDNPDPIKLKLEKVYQPCILQTKKRYVGYMYENPDQKDPVYEAKGIETVRRDGCPAVSKMLEKCLRILFETKDVSLVKKYVMKQFSKIIAGRVSIQDLTFAKEYRGASGYKPGACVPALELTKRWTAIDKRKEPRSGERVPYVIVNGPPGLPLIRLVRCPRDLLEDPALKPNALYYITKVIIPPINRCFSLIGADANTWFNQMPRRKTQFFANSITPKKKTTISQYFSTSCCVSCEEQTQTGICQNCVSKPQETVYVLMEKLRMWEMSYHNIIKICQTCTSSVNEVKCISLDCPVYYKRIQTGRDELQTNYVRQLLSSSDFDF
ncbi:unnamed protein product [Phyllotreta striolata]|uniref:DNA polymerase zeta catalytic subunit n=1 Tax=Phyllotreta striolata TaxID=444603 RepID=A0A9N9XME2_PHYSR|nr:unnamed protein product [Phyllotreta striolata]